MFDSEAELPPPGRYEYAPRPLHGADAAHLFPMLPWVGIVETSGLSAELREANRALDATPIVPVLKSVALGITRDALLAEYPDNKEGVLRLDDDDLVSMSDTYTAEILKG